MCGVPYHAAEVYISRLIEKGYKVAICEQVEDPKKAKGMVKREVIRVVTPGTMLDGQNLDESKNNYLMSIVCTEDRFGVSVADVSTGECLVTEVDAQRKLLDEIHKFMPAEIICNQAFLVCGVDVEDLKNRLSIALSALDDWYFDDSTCEQTLKEHFQCATLEGLGIGDFSCGAIAAGGAVPVSAGNPEKQPFPDDPYHPLQRGKIYASGQFYQTESGADGDSAGENRREDPFSGCWTRPALPWEPECCGGLWSSLSLTSRRLKSGWTRWKS